MQNVEGKTAFITGGASGMGLGMAGAFAKAGMKVVIADIRQQALDAALAGFATAHVAENLRGAVQSVPAGQMEAAKAIGLTFPRRLRYVILPQAIRRMLPPWVNTCLEIVKGTTLLSVIGVVELLLASQQVIARNYMVIDFYLLACAIYLVINFSIAQLGALLERRFSYIRY